MKLVLERTVHTDFGTFGCLYGPSMCLYTVERPWLDNRPWVSCIPIGTYKLKDRRYNKGGYDALEITKVPNRSLILIHIANRPWQVQGCVGVGLRLGVVAKEWAVVSSSSAFSELMEQHKREAFNSITVRNYCGGIK